MELPWKGLGCEIWRVPEGWDHPLDRFGNPVRLYTQDFWSAVQMWQKGYADWNIANIPYWYAVGMPPVRVDYLPFEMGQSCFQLYDDGGLGIPVSPIMDSLEEVRNCLVANGYDRTFARAFTKIGFNRPPWNQDGTGFLNIKEVKPSAKGLDISFIVNGYKGRATASNDLSFSGLNGSSIKIMDIIRAEGQLGLGESIYAYPDNSAVPEKHPDFLDSLVILLNYLAEKNLQQEQQREVEK